MGSSGPTRGTSCVLTHGVKHGRQLSKQRHVACVLNHVVKHGSQPQRQACRVCADTWAAAWDAAVTECSGLCGWACLSHLKGPLAPPLRLRRVRLPFGDLPLGAAVVVLCWARAPRLGCCCACACMSVGVQDCLWGLVVGCARVQVQHVRRHASATLRSVAVSVGGDVFLCMRPRLPQQFRCSRFELWAAKRPGSLAIC